jgi:NADP-dependent 3-hydroxy acid dehydrogenase YdfG
MSGIFTDQIAVVTGASSGIGRAVALHLVQHGATVCLVGRPSEALQTLVASAQASVADSHSFWLDLAKDDDILKLTAHLQEQFGRVDILVHSAGVFAMGKLEIAPIEALDRQYRINVRAPYLLPLLKKSQGQIVFINSSVGLNARASVGQYAATKHALKAIADSLREEVNADGIRVLSVYPGRTASPMQEAIYHLEGKSYTPDTLLQPEDIATGIMNALALPRTAEITDINIRPMKKL